MTERNIVYFPKPEMCVLWNHEFTGQMSDGVYENDPVTDTGLGIKWWYSEAKVGNPSQNDRDCPYILLNLVYELEKCNITRYIAYAILINEKPELLNKLSSMDEIYIEQAANSIWHADSLYYTALDDNFEEDFKKQISYITLEEVKTIFKKWSYVDAWCYTMKLVKEMDSCIH